MKSRNRNYALDVWLCRPVSWQEAERATSSCQGRYAVAPDRRSVAAVIKARSLEAAFSTAWRELADLGGLPVDVAWTTHPDRSGMLGLDFRFDQAVTGRLDELARARHQSRAGLVKEVLVEALRRADHEQAEKLAQAVGALLADSSVEQLLKAVARTALAD